MLHAEGPVVSTFTRVKSMPAGFFKLLVVVVLSCGAASISHGQERGKVDLEAAEIITQLIGAPVYAMDGIEIGQVADIYLDQEGRPVKVRMTTGAHLGFGARIVDIRQGAFTPLRGAVVLDLPADAVPLLPNATEPGTDD